MDIYNWNPVFNIVMNIKKDYINKFNDNNMDFKTWLEKLNKEEYNNIFSCYTKPILIRVKILTKLNKIIIIYL